MTQSPMGLRRIGHGLPMGIDIIKTLEPDDSAQKR
jgi:hypothetical protein